MSIRYIFYLLSFDVYDTYSLFFVHIYWVHGLHDGIFRTIGHGYSSNSERLE